MTYLLEGLGVGSIAVTGIARVQGLLALQCFQLETALPAEQLVLDDVPCSWSRTWNNS